MNEEEADCLFSDDEADPRIEEMFLKPLMSLQPFVETKYQLSEPPEHFREARQFAQHLWECSDLNDAQSLCESFPLGASKFVYVVATLGLVRLSKRRGQELAVEQRDGKPFYGLSHLGLTLLDEVEGANPGKTR